MNQISVELWTTVHTVLPTPNPDGPQKFIAGIVRDVLSGKLDSIDEIKDESAARFAAGVTRQSWSEQWAQLNRLEIGLPRHGSELTWFKELDVYFEMRNCIIHRQGRVSSLLHQKTDYYQKKKVAIIEIWPQHLDFYRHRLSTVLGTLSKRLKQNSRRRQKPNKPFNPTYAAGGHRVKATVTRAAHAG